MSQSPIFRQFVPLEKFCPGCETVKPVGEFYRNSARSDGVAPRCMLCHNTDVAARKQRQRLEAILLLGGRCQSPTCAVPGGMRDVRALQFDHVEGDGRKRQRDGENGHRIITAILAGSSEFQLLCANCNWIKKAESDETVGDREYCRVAPTTRVLQGRYAVVDLHDDLIGSSHG